MQRRKPGLAIFHVPLDGGWKRQKNYPGDNRLVAGESSHRPRGSVPRCRLFLSWPCIRGQGWGCSPIKRDRELGLDRRETGRILFTGSVGCLRGKCDQYERNIALWPLVYRLSDRATPGSYAALDKSWKHLSSKPFLKIDIRTFGLKGAGRRPVWWSGGVNTEALAEVLSPPPPIAQDSSLILYCSHRRIRSRTRCHIIKFILF